MNSVSQNILNVAYINMHGQTNLTEAKQVQLEDFIKFNKIDIAHLQETEICDDTFSTCNFISSSFDIHANNAANKYGTSSLVKNIYSVENLRCDNLRHWRVHLWEPACSLRNRCSVKIK